MIPRFSIIICSLGRDEILERCLKSIYDGTYQDFEIILCKEEGNLVELKDNGWRSAKGEIFVWIDDDVICLRGWLKNMDEVFIATNAVGVTGPTYVPFMYQRNRDIFRRGLFKKFYNWFFLEGKALLPGRITSCGANTIGANFITPYSNLTQEVDFLEPSQFAFRRLAVEEVDGFDKEYKSIAEWCDVDLCYRIKKHTGHAPDTLWTRSGHKLIYSPKVKVMHLPIQDKVYNKRLSGRQRYLNYDRFARKHLKRTPKHYIYRLFLAMYFFLKGRII